jgi:hypothetical protein
MVLPIAMLQLLKMVNHPSKHLKLLLLMASLQVKKNSKMTSLTLRLLVGKHLQPHLKVVHHLLRPLKLLVVQYLLLLKQLAYRQKLWKLDWPQLQKPLKLQLLMALPLEKLSRLPWRQVEMLLTKF